MRITIKNLLHLTASIATIGGTGRGNPPVQKTEPFEEHKMKLLSRKKKMTEDTVVAEGAEDNVVAAEVEAAPTSPRAPKTTILPKAPEAVLTVNAEKIAKYKGQRAERAAILANGMTFGEYMAAGGDKGFLSFFIKDGAVTVG